MELSERIRRLEDIYEKSNGCSCNEDVCDRFEIEALLSRVNDAIQAFRIRHWWKVVFQEVDW